MAIKERRTKMATTEQLMAQYGVAWFGFDESSGNVYDKLGLNNYVGTVYANVTRVEGWNGEGYAMNFNRTSTSYINFNDKVIPTGNITLKFKLKLHTIPTSENQEIITNAFATATDAGIRVWVDTVGNIVFSCCRKVSDKWSFTVGKSALFDNKWHEYMLSWNADENIVNLYEDEKIVGIDISIGGNSLTPTYNLRIGNQPSSGNNRYFNGQIDDLQIYNKALSPSDFIQKRLAIKSISNKNLVLSPISTRIKEIPNTEEDTLLTQGGVIHEIDSAIDRPPIDLTRTSTEYEIVSNTKSPLNNGKMFTIPIDNNFKTVFIEDND